MSTLLSIYESRPVHDINVRSSNGVEFLVDIFSFDDKVKFDSTVTVLEKGKDGIEYKIKADAESVEDNFRESIIFILKYFKHFKLNDKIIEVHNKCNCTFISSELQKKILNSLDVNVEIKVN